MSILITVTLFLVVLVPQVQLVAQEHHHYKLIDIKTFRGPSSYLTVPNGSNARILNNRGALASWADTIKPDPYPSFCFNPDCFVSRALQWQNGVRTKLGGLAPGLSSLTTWISPNGLVAGLSENGQMDPLFPGFPVAHAVLWKNNVITDLGTLDGGFESIALSANSHGQVVGAADDDVPDPTPLNGYYFGWTTRTRAFLWQDGAMQDLHTLGGRDAAAYLINENGQVAGVSYIDSKPSAYCAKNVGYSLTTGAFIWENGKMTDLGNFGGTCAWAFDLNNHGQIIGGSTLPGDHAQHPFLWEQGNLKDLGTFGGAVGSAISLNEVGTVVGFAYYPGDQIFRASLWDKKGITDLGTLDVNSFAEDVNAEGQVVGSSTDAQANNHRAFLWENGGPMVDLNSLVPPNSSLLLTDPANINDQGEIAGQGLPSGCSEIDFCGHAFLLVPCDDNHPGVEGCDYSLVDASTNFVAPQNPASAPMNPASNQNNVIRRMLRRRLGPPYGVPAPDASSEPGVPESAEGAPAADGATRKTGDSMPNSLDLLDADPAFHVTTTALRCLPLGWPCPDFKGIHGCCGTLKCVFRGGSTRAGYKCEP